MADLYPTDLKPINIPLEYAAGFITPAGVTTVKKPSEVLIDILSKIKYEDTLVKGMYTMDTTTNNYALTNIDANCDFDQNKSATIDGAVMTYMLSKYYKDYKIKKSSGKMHIKVGDPTKPVYEYDFYNLSSFTLKEQKTPITTDNDVMHAAILWLNSLVVGMRKAGLAGMHPLSRVAASESDIAAINELIYRVLYFGTIYEPLLYR